MMLGQTPHAIFEIRVYPRFVRTLTIRGSSCRLSVPAWNVTICLVRVACQHVIEYLCFLFPAFLFWMADDLLPRAAVLL